MDKLFPPRSATTRHRSSSDFKGDSFILTQREKQIRRITQEKNTSIVLDTAYKYKPQSHLPVSDTVEVALQLTLLKKNFDRQCTEWNKRDSFLNGLKSEMDKITAIEKRQSTYKEIKQLEIKSIKREIEKVEEEQIREEGNREIFLHVLDRMRTTIVHLKSKTHGYKSSLHKKSFSLLTEKEIFNKTKESQARTLHAFVRLKNIVDDQKNEEKKEVIELEKNVEKRKCVSALRSERRKKQGEIIEKAMIDSQSSKLEDLRERFFLNKLWYSFSTLRFEREKKKSKKFEDAYLKIKLATGISDVPLFVEKYLTREKRYRDMLVSVKQKEEELIKYKEKIEKMQAELERFSNKASVTHLDDKYKNELHRIHKENCELLIKKTNIIQIYDKISKWLKRMKNKLQINYSDTFFDTQPKDEKTNFRNSILDIKSTVIGLLRSMNKEGLFESKRKKDNLRNIINDIPENLRSAKRFYSITEKSELLGLETETIQDEITMKKNRRSN